MAMAVAVAVVAVVMVAPATWSPSKIASTKTFNHQLLAALTYFSIASPPFIPSIHPSLLPLPLSCSFSCFWLPSVVPSHFHPISSIPPIPSSPAKYVRQTYTNHFNNINHNQSIMSVVSLLNVNVVNNPAKFTEKYQLEITFECLEHLTRGNSILPSPLPHFKLETNPNGSILVQISNGNSPTSDLQPRK